MIPKCYLTEREIDGVLYGESIHARDSSEAAEICLLSGVRLVGLKVMDKDYDVNGDDVLTFMLVNRFIELDEFGDVVILGNAGEQLEAYLSNPMLSV